MDAARPEEGEGVARQGDGDAAVMPNLDLPGVPIYGSPISELVNSGNKKADSPGSEALWHWTAKERLKKPAASRGYGGPGCYDRWPSFGKSSS